MRTHINLEGRELPCKAQPGKCRFEVVDKEVPKYVANAGSIDEQLERKCPTRKVVNFVVKRQNDFMTKTSEGRLSGHITKDRWMRKKLLLDDKTSRVAVFSMEGENGLEVHVLNDVGTLTVYRELKDRFTGKDLSDAEELENIEQVDGVMITLMAATKSRIANLYKQAGETEEPSQWVLENADLMRELAANEAIVHEQLKAGKTLPDKVKEIRLHLAETGVPLEDELARLKELRKEDARQKNAVRNKPEGAYYLVREAEIHAHRVTADIYDMKPKRCRLINLDKVVKSEESLKERLSKPGCSIKTIKDTLSYTLETDKANVVSVIKELRNSLNKEGYYAKYENKGHLEGIADGTRTSLKLLVKVNDGYNFEIEVQASAKLAAPSKKKSKKPKRENSSNSTNLGVLKRGGTVGPNKLRIPKMRR